MILSILLGSKFPVYCRNLAATATIAHAAITSQLTNTVHATQPLAQQRKDWLILAAMGACTACVVVHVWLRALKQQHIICFNNRSPQLDSQLLYNGWPRSGNEDCVAAALAVVARL